MLLCGTQKKWRETQIPLGDEEISKKGGGGHLKGGGGNLKKKKSQKSLPSMVNPCKFSNGKTSLVIFF
jgi:hypothetical protein